MKLVAAAKVNRVQKAVLGSRPYTQKIKEIFAGLQTAIDPEAIDQFPLLKKREKESAVLLVSIAADRGLCGAYNSSVIKATRKRITELEAEGKKVVLITIGRKTVLALNRKEFSERGIEVVESFTNLDTMPSPQEANLIVDCISDLYISGRVDKVEVISTKFINMVTSKAMLRNFLPISADALDPEDVSHYFEHKYLEKKAAGETGLASDPMVIFDPDTTGLINTLLPLYIRNSVYAWLLEASASEQAARMTAMANATSNADEVIRKLVLKYNKARQAGITQEISEIVAGAAAQ
jgi:F-type H+-transporting ATPase subunit gamma